MGLILFILAFLLMTIGVLFRKAHMVTKTYVHPNQQELVDYTSRVISPVFEKHPALNVFLWISSVGMWLLSVLAAFIAQHPILPAWQLFTVYFVALTLFAVGQESLEWREFLIGGAVGIPAIFSIIRLGFPNSVLFQLAALLVCLVVALGERVPRLFRLLCGAGVGIILSLLLGSL